MLHRSSNPRLKTDVENARLEARFIRHGLAACRRQGWNFRRNGDPMRGQWILNSSARFETLSRLRWGVRFARFVGYAGATGGAGGEN